MSPEGTPSLAVASIVAVGSELLTPFRADTNSLYLTRRLNELGIDVRTKTIVGDDRRDLARELRHALGHADLVVLTGGLGPTADDLTRDAVSEVLDVPLREDARIVEQIRARFSARGWRMPDVNRRQALVPAGAIVLPNARGTAPGLWLEWQGKVVLVLPGPPRELQPMIEGPAAARLQGRAGRQRLFRRVLRVTGRPESHVEECAQPIYARWQAATPSIVTTVLAAPGQIELHLAARADRAIDAQTALDGATRELAAALGSDVFSVDGQSLEEVVGGLLRGRGWRVAVAESCTGGLITSRLTDVPGSSDYVDRGVIVYSNDAKTALLGVPARLIAEAGAVSEPVARAMASGARARAAADVGIGVTGIAGPAGATPHKPVGTVCVAVAVTGRDRARTFVFPGSRDMVKRQASQAALDMLRRMLDDCA